MKHDGACTWLLIDRNSALCVIIDPIAELGERIERYIRCQDLRIAAVLDTHSHADHASSRTELLAHLHEYVLDAKPDVDPLGWPVAANATPLDTMTCGHYQLRRLPIPGHTADSVAYILNDQRTPGHPRQVFVGDTVLSGGIGRSNFASSSSAAMYHSLRLLATEIGPDTLLCAAHDYNHEFATTLAVESRSNPLLADVLANAPISEAEFVNAKQAVDAVLNDASGSIMMCGALRCSTNVQSAAVEFKPDALRQYLQQNPDAILVDVREAYECAMGSKLELLDEAHARAVPLSRLADALPEWLAAPEKPLVFFCRSGNRSALATKCLRRLGHPNAFHLRGGLALFS
jgi:cysteine desulfurase